MSEIMVPSGARYLKQTVAEAATALEQEGEVRLTGMNSAISRTVELAEFLKRCISGLHQNVEIIGESGKTRILCHLSTKGFSAKGKGYMGPIAEAELKPVEYADLKNPNNELIRELIPARRQGNQEEKPEPATKGESKRGRRARRGRGRERGGRRRGASRGRGSDSRTFVDTKKYYRSEEENKKEDLPENVILVGAAPGISRSISRALSLFEETKCQEVIIKASGNAIANAIRLAEMIRYGKEGIYSRNELDNRDIKTVYKPREQGLDDVEVVRHVASIKITLAVNPKDKALYQAPPPSSEIKTLERNE